MILQALYHYYKIKSVSGDIAPEGYSSKRIDFLIILDTEGNYIDIESLQTIQRNKFIGRHYWVPAIGKQVERHSNAGNDANLLWDNTEFVLGIGKKGEIKSNSFIETIESYYPDPLKDIQAVLTFLRQGKSKRSFFQKLINHTEYGEQISSGKVIVSFRIGSSKPIISEDHVKKALEAKSYKDEVLGTCLITGEEKVPIELTHTPTKGVIGSQTSGASLISFNKQSFISYHKEQSLNAPVSKKAAGGYTKALQHLIDSSTNKVRIADTTIVFWATKSVQEVNIEEALPFVIVLQAFDKYDPDKGVKAIKLLFDAVRTGKISRERDNRFYVLGIAPNSARLSIRFWKIDTVERIGYKIIKHLKDIDIIKAEYESPHLSLSEILASVSVETKDRTKPNLVFFRGKFYDVPPNLAGSVIESILDDTPYPATIMQQCIRRIRAEVSKKDRNGKLVNNVTRSRAAILKAYLNRLNKNNNIKEVLMALDKENKEVGYVLGRLFALLERIQEESTKPIRLNTTIRERYYGTFSSSPIVVMPLLLKLKNHHLAKLSGGLKNWFENELQEVIDLLKPLDIPAHLSLEQQSLFAVGYYHQRKFKQDKSSK